LVQTPPELGMSVFHDVNKSIPLYVPEVSIALYQAAEQWRDFNNIQIGLDDIRFANKVDILVYPNPANDKAKLDIQGLNEDANVIVYNINGRTLQTLKIKKGQKELEIDLTNYAKGVYTINIVNENISYSEKIILQ
jgi:hypothetical protein